MLDTYGRKYIKKQTNKIAIKLNEKDVKPNTITHMALIIGIIASVFLYFDYKLLSILSLWLSGLFDVLDGNLARISGKTSEYGMLLDIFFDRIVEGGILVVLALTNIYLRLNIVFLFFAILMSMTIFLISGVIIRKESEKSFYYQAGLMERTEGFILLTLAIIFKSQLIINIFTLLVIITVFQRFIEVNKYINVNG